MKGNPVEARGVPVESECLWYVAHTRPRCEKKLAHFCAREGLPCTLPAYLSVRKYRGKQVRFEKVLFPGYLFLRAVPWELRRLHQNDYVANLLRVSDQQQFQQQLDDILRALEHRELVLTPHLTAGVAVRIKTGPLRGLEGFVEARTGESQVILRIDFIKQAAALRVEADELELL